LPLAPLAEMKPLDLNKMVAPEDAGGNPKAPPAIPAVPPKESVSFLTPPGPKPVGTIDAPAPPLDGDATFTPSGTVVIPKLKSGIGR
jgi:hypothetical protein